MIEARGLAIPGRLKPTEIELAPGEMVGLIGPNGGGKTSLLRAMAGHEDALGRVEIDGLCLTDAGPRRSQLVAMMASSRELTWAIPVRDVVRLGNEASSDRVIDHLLDRFELGTFAARPANRLSTGERARVLIARAMASEARLMLLDEPLSNLDPYWVLRFVEAMRVRADEGVALVCALHDLTLADRFDRLLLVAGGEVTMDGPPSTVIGSAPFSVAFRVVPDGPRWRIRASADPRSSP